MSAAPSTDEPESHQHWSHQHADYSWQECPNCARQRVLLYANGRRICEKCNWDLDAGGYAEDHELIG